MAEYRQDEVRAGVAVMIDEVIRILAIPKLGYDDTGKCQTRANPTRSQATGWISIAHH